VSLVGTDPDAALVERLRAGEQSAFTELVGRYSGAVMRLARVYVPSTAVAEEVVQETWVGVLNGLDRFEGRASLKTWIFRILTNVALKGGARERRSVPWSSLARTEDTGEPSVDPDRFLPADHELFPGHWAVPPTRWPTPEEGLLSGETREVIVAALKDLPPAQRTVVTLREIGGWSAEDVAEALGISPGNQRVLLHRARTGMRAAVERFYGDVTPEPPEGTTQKDPDA
jgi:RNA polymerase sigma-70 factor, ECF subfamily